MHFSQYFQCVISGEVTDHIQFHRLLRCGGMSSPLVFSAAFVIREKNISGPLTRTPATRADEHQTLFTPGFKIPPGQSDREWTALSTNVCVNRLVVASASVKRNLNTGSQLEFWGTHDRHRCELMMCPSRPLVLRSPETHSKV